MKAFGILKCKLSNSVICQILTESGTILFTGEFKSLPMAINNLTKWCAKSGHDFEWADESNDHWIAQAKKNYEKSHDCKFEGNTLDV